MSTISPRGFFSSFGPVGDAYHSLVSCDGAFEATLGNVYICGQELAVGVEYGKAVLYFDGSYEGLVFFLDYFGDYGFGFDAATTRCDGYAHAVAIECVHGIAFGHENALAVIIGDYGVLAVGAAYKGAHGIDAAAGALVFAGGYFDKFAVKGQLGKAQGHGPLLCLGRDAKGGGHLFVVECRD